MEDHRLVMKQEDIIALRTPYSALRERWLRWAALSTAPASAWPHNAIAGMGQESDELRSREVLSGVDLPDIGRAVA
jgi:hypothetical protein